MNFSMNSTDYFFHERNSTCNTTSYFEYFSGMFLEFEELIICMLFGLFHMLFVYGYFFLNVLISSKLRSYGQRRESLCCLYILLIYGLLFSFSPPVLYELISDKFYSLNQISSEIPRNLSLYVHVVSSYVVVVFALNCYYIVFRGSKNQKQGYFYIYLFIIIAFVVSLLLTFFLWVLRYFLLDESNPYCHFNFMPSLQSIYCPVTKYWVLFILLVYFVPMVILFVVYPMVIHELFVAKYSFLNKTVGPCKAFLYLSDWQFLKLSFIITLVFLGTNIPYMILEILFIFQFKISVIGIISGEIIARYITFSYPWICVACMVRERVFLSIFGKLNDFLFLERGSPSTSRIQMRSLLVDCESVIKEQDEMLKVMRVHVKSVPPTKCKAKFTSEVQVHG